MGITERHDLIKRLQVSGLRGAPFDLAALRGLGISPQLAAKYVRNGWLVRLAQGVYAFPNDPLDRYRTIQVLQAKVPGLHLGGRSALAIHGIRHNLGSRERLVLWGDARFRLPAWFLTHFPARYAGARLFSWPGPKLSQESLVTPPDLPKGSAVSTPERAVLELLYDVGTNEGLEDAHNLFEGMRGLRFDHIGQLLSCCTSVKTIRLFLTWARETRLLDIDLLQKRYRVHGGGKQRWMKRLKDGTLLTLKPHG
jgi:hypothetical protein